MPDNLARIVRSPVQSAHMPTADIDITLAFAELDEITTTEWGDRT